MKLPAYRVFLSDGSNYVTSMAQGITLEKACAYFVGEWFTDEDFATGKETHRQAIKVEVA